MYNILTQMIVLIFSNILTYTVSRYDLMHKSSSPKMQIAYDKFYYPVLVWGEKISIKPTKQGYQEFSEKVEKRLMSYEKYITYTTKKRFLDYKDSLFDYKDAINSFECFYSDIKRNNRRLHSALGYWEPNWFEKFSARDIVEQCTVIVFILSFLGMVIMAGCGIYFGIESPITKVVMGVWYLSIMIFTIVFLIILLVCLIKTINKQKRRGIKVMRRKKRDFDKWG